MRLGTPSKSFHSLACVCAFVWDVLHVHMCIILQVAVACGWPASFSSASSPSSLLAMFLVLLPRFFFFPFPPTPFIFHFISFHIWHFNSPFFNILLISHFFFSTTTATLYISLFSLDYFISYLIFDCSRSHNSCELSHYWNVSLRSKVFYPFFLLIIDLLLIFRRKRRRRRRVAFYCSLFFLPLNRAPSGYANQSMSRHFQTFCHNSIYNHLHLCRNFLEFPSWFSISFHEIRHKTHNDYPANTLFPFYSLFSHTYTYIHCIAIDSLNR